MTTPAVHAILSLASGAAAGAYAVLQGLLLLYASHRWVVLWRAFRPGSRAHRPHPREAAAAWPAPDLWPVVTVQLPLYNERLVAERLIEAVGGLRYPAGRLEIQVLDDSTDDTTEIARRAARRLRARGVDVRLIHRARRGGFKAGALANGLRTARGELIAVFDADFVPEPDTLERLVPRFADPEIGMVQGRWGHLNRGRSWLTAAQAVLLDAHFLIEHPSRMDAGLFFNFNGTAGVWRRAAIESAGGWSNDTLTEDLDLSYRAQLRAWRFAFDASACVPAELPVEIGALLSQQRRWATGSIQTARKLLPAVLASPARAAVKLEACVHLTGNVVYPLLLGLSLLLLPALYAMPAAPEPAMRVFETVLVVLGIAPVVLFLGAGQVRAGARPAEVVMRIPGALVLCAGLALNNSIAVFRGLAGRPGAWERTPKTGDRGGTRGRSVYAPAHPAWSGLEAGLALLTAAAAALCVRDERFRALPFLALIATGCAGVGLASLRERVRSGRPSERSG